jgi:hypothetical protein
VEEEDETQCATIGSTPLGFGHELPVRRQTAAQ